MAIFTKKKRSNNNNIAALLILGALSSLLCGAVVPVSGKVHVSLINGMGDGETITVVCQSKDDDLGPHLLSNGQYYEWSFRPNIWHTTLFYCDVSWRDVQDLHFDAYAYERDRDGCGSDCRWLFATEGVYGFDHRDATWVYRFPWRP